MIRTEMLQHMRYAYYASKTKIAPITLDEYIKIWDDSGKWLERGRSTGAYYLTRIDKDKPWAVDNCCIKGGDSPMEKAWRLQRNQAKFRNEKWDYPFDEWEEDWEPHWIRKGKKKDQYRMWLIDKDKPWSRSNTKIGMPKGTKSVTYAKPCTDGFNNYDSVKALANAKSMSPHAARHRITSKNYPTWKFI